MFIFMFNHVAPWSCETWHFVPLYVHTFSRMTIKLNLSWLKVISLYLYCLCGRLGMIKMFTKSYPTCLSTYLLAYICADMIRHQHTATLALSWLPAKMSECRLRDVNHRSSIQTKDNIVANPLHVCQYSKRDNTPAYHASQRAFHVLSQIQAGVNQRFGLGPLEHAWPSPPRASVYGVHCAPTLTDTEAWVTFKSRLGITYLLQSECWERWRPSTFMVMCAMQLLVSMAMLEGA